MNPCTKAPTQTGLVRSVLEWVQGDDSAFNDLPTVEECADKALEPKLKGKGKGDDKQAEG